jgi:DNA-binding response OmpR family regulator
LFAVFIWLDAIIKKMFFKSVSNMSKLNVPRVLLLDDDAQIRQLLSQLLQQAGFAVTAVARIAEFERALTTLGADVCIIDWMLAGESGLKLAEKLSQQVNRPPMLMLSANATLDERLQGLSVVDDYLTKPFEPKELIARLHALLRRVHNDKTAQRLVFGLWQLDSGSHQLFYDEQPISLSAGEWQLLWYLAQRPERLVSREQLLQVLDDESAGERAVDIRISRLRKKLGIACPIETVWGQGYKFVPPTVRTTS